jgi:peroxiredoxin
VQGVLIIGISSEPLATLKTFEAQHPHSYPMLNDIAQRTAKKYQAYFAYPTLVYIDRHGVIQTIETGGKPKRYIEKRIRELLDI